MKTLLDLTNVNYIEGETFQLVKGYEDYLVSNLGRVLSLKRDEPKILKPGADAEGYVHVRIYNNEEHGKAKQYENGNKVAKLFKIHRLVALHHVPGYFEGAVVDHINMDKTDNRAVNLRWVTQKENMNAWRKSKKQLEK